MKNYHQGTLHDLVVGNQCLLSDGRKTPGFIKEIHFDEGMFLWEITGYEDTGKFWEMRFEDIAAYNFPNDAKQLADIGEYELVNRKYNEKLIIQMDSEKKSDTLARISEENKRTKQWLCEHSRFLQENQALDPTRETGYPELYLDLQNFLSDKGLWELEKRTEEILVLNPYSGEWMKGMRIVLAKLGLCSFEETIPRTKDIFAGDGTKEKRERYLLTRISFLQSLFELLGVTHMPIYRGIQTPGEFFVDPASLISCTTSLKTGLSYSSFEQENPEIRNACLIKVDCPIEEILMTYFETKAFNQQYLEQEVTTFNWLKEKRLF